MYRGPLDDGPLTCLTSSGFSNLREADSPENASESSSPYDVSNVEAYLYYFGIRGPRRWGPKLIYRTSKDVFPIPSGPAQDRRAMRLVPVYEHKELGTGNVWDTIRSEVRDPLRR